MNNYSKITFENRNDLLERTFLPLYELSRSDINQEKDKFLEWLFLDKTSLTYEDMFNRISGLDQENEATYKGTGYVIKLAEAFVAYIDEIKFIIENINLEGTNKWIPLLEKGLQLYNDENLTFDEKLQLLYKLFSLDGEGKEPYYMFFSEVTSWEGLFREEFTNAQLNLLNFSEIGKGCIINDYEALLKYAISQMKNLEIEMQLQKTEKHFK